MQTQPLNVLYEDNHLLVVNKPAELPTMGTPDGKPTLLTVAKDYIKRRYSKPGEVYLGIVSRLDAPVTGVIVLARTSKAAGRLTEQYRTHVAEKTYWVVVEGLVEPTSGTCVDWVRHDPRHRCMHVTIPSAEGAKKAILSYRRLATVGQDSLLEVTLETGRKHQIRLQLAHLGHPVVGDIKYDSKRTFAPGIALHARRLVITHPISGRFLDFTAPLPASWRPWRAATEGLP